MRELPPLSPDPVIEFYKKHVDRTLLRENLKLTVEQRLQQLMDLQRFAEELRRAGKAVRRAADPEVKMDIPVYQRNRAKFSADELLRYDRQWVAFSPDGSRVVASSERLSDLEAKLVAAGEDPEQVGFEWIEAQDISLGAMEWS